MRALLSLLLLACLPGLGQAEDVKVVGAGSLSEVFNAIYADYRSSPTGQRAPLAITSAWGPSGVLRQRLEKGEPFDLYASAAVPHAQALTAAGLGGPTVMFARNALCAVTRKDAPVTTANLVDTLLRPELRLGTSTPVADPAGDYTWQLFHLIDERIPGAFDKLSGKARQLFGGAASTAPANGRHRIAELLDKGEVDLFIYYCSGVQQVLAQSTAYKKIELPPELAVGAEYGLTVARNASPGASLLALHLLSPSAQRILQAHGLTPVALPIGPVAQ
jgi:ABC-type molybdate transport system substrate-binding protein